MRGSDDTRRIEPTDAGRRRSTPGENRSAGDGKTTSRPSGTTGAGRADSDGSGSRRRRNGSAVSRRRERERQEQARLRAEENARRARLRRTNREIMAVSYVVILLFVAMIGYMGFFLYYEAEGYRNNAYNAKRLETLSDKYTRGKIQAADGTVLAETTTTGDEEIREYPFGRTFAHVVGYTVNGVTGLESQGGSYLTDSHINPLLRIFDALRGRKSVGDTVTTTLNVKLQQEAYEALEGKEGAIVVMEPATGKILAMVSCPDFNPNTLADDWEELVDEDNDRGNLVNRATQGMYAPGSTFKILTTLEYMREYPDDWDKFSFDCDSTYEVGEYTIRCSHGTAHGDVDITDAFAHSCNGAFAAVGQKLSFAKFSEMCASFGFNQPGVGALAYSTGSFTLDNNDSVWNVLQTSIGQGETQVTPLFNAMLAASVANEGVMMQPYLMDSVRSVYGDRVASFEPQEIGTVMTKEEAQELTRMMEAVVSYGTGDEAAGDGYHAVGKTGSAETSKDAETNAWFIGYASDDANPERQIAVSVLVVRGGSGGSVAAPIAGKLFRTYFKGDET